MNRKYSTIISRIEQELFELQQIVQRIGKAWRKAERTDDDLYLDSVALNLHGFYVGLEMKNENDPTDLQDKEEQDRIYASSKRTQGKDCYIRRTEMLLQQYKQQVKQKLCMRQSHTHYVHLNLPSSRRL